ncbi:hypothetical protein [Streptomyces microflavus]|uniref:hypothetical protein n=1 Tax=Streptomyces microflavus TaxID=1919 RepID=UPI0033AD8774
MSVAISPTAPGAPAPTTDGAIRVWDPVTCTATLTGHTKMLNSLAISPVGAWLANTGDDGTVWVWSVAEGSIAAVARADGLLAASAWGTINELVVGGRRGLYLFELLT